MAISDDWLTVAAEITGTFETMNKNPWAAVTGDFDGMGISCGILQWNIGMGSLQPLVKAVGQAVVLKYMPSKGAEMWNAANAAKNDGLKIVRKWQNGTTLKPDIRSELSALMGSAEMRPQQLARVRDAAETANVLADHWATQRSSTKTLRDFCWFFDLVTQNGSLKNLTLKDVRDFEAANGTDKADDAICNWLKAAPANAWQRDMAKKNAALWLNKVDAASLDLFVLSHLRSLLATSRAKWLVMNRKGILTTGKGWLNGELFDVSAKIGV